MSAFRFEATTTERSSGLQDELGAHGVDQDAFGGHVRVVQGHALEGFVPEDHAVLLGVGFGDGGDLLYCAGSGEVEGEAHDPLAALFGEQGGLEGDLIAGAAAAEVPSAQAGVLAFAVFADHDPVELGVVGLAQRGLDAGQELHRADVGPLVEVLRDVQAQAPEADVVRDVFPADGAEVDGVKVLQGLQALRVHHLAGLFVVAAAPGELGPFEGELAGGILGEGVQDAAPGGDNFLAHAVGGDGSDAEFLGGAHVPTSSLSVLAASHCLSSSSRRPGTTRRPRPRSDPVDRVSLLVVPSTAERTPFWTRKRALSEQSTGGLLGVAGGDVQEGPGGGSQVFFPAQDGDVQMGHGFDQECPQPGLVRQRSPG